MRRLVFILIFLIPFTTNGQGQETIEPVKKAQSVTGIYIGAYLTPEFAFRTISNNDGSKISEYVIEYKLNSKMHLSTMPTLSYGVLDILDAPITGKLYSGGLQSGWYMNL